MNLLAKKSGSVVRREAPYITHARICNDNIMDMETAYE